MSDAFDLDALIEREQREEWKKKGTKMMLGGFVGVFVLLMYNFLKTVRVGPIQPSLYTVVLALGVVASVVLYIVGCCNLARGKGKSVAFGLIGILGVIGLIILVVVKEEPYLDDHSTNTVIRWEGENSSSDPTVRITSRD